MTDEQKNLDKLYRLIAAYGADAGRWPDAEQESLRALFVNNPEAAEALKEADALDALLNSMPTPAPANTTLIDRLMNIPDTLVVSGQENSRRTGGGASEAFWKLFRPRLLPQAAGILIAGVMGVMLGLSGVDRPSGPVAVFDASAYMFGDPGLARDLEDID